MQKKKILTSQAIPGMIISDDVFSASNQLIIAAGTPVTDRVITRLKFHSIHQVWIAIDGEAVPESVSDTSIPISQLSSTRIRATEEFRHFSEALQKTTNAVRKQIEGIANGQPINEDLLTSEIHSIISCSRNGAHVFDMLHCLREYDDETYRHCVNVALISYTLGTWLNFTRRDLDTLILCGLMHDIGKLMISSDILRKPSRLTPEERSIIQTHSVRGYNILRSQKTNIHVQMAAMMHHERCDGSGYPLGLKGDQIDRFAKVVMIADVYEAMTAARVYRGPLCPFEVISIFESEGLSQYETKYVMTFLEHICETYLHCSVRLTDKTEGTIVMINPTYLSHPVVKVGRRFVDLSKQPELSIEAFI